MEPAFIFLLLIISLLFIKDKIDLFKARKTIRELENKVIVFDERFYSYKNILLKHFNIFIKLLLIDQHLKEDEKKLGQKILRRINQLVYDEGKFNWNLIMETIENLHDGFPTALKQKYPQLDDSEYKICCLEYAGLNNGDIADIFALKLNTIQMKKSNIRKKLGIEEYGKIAEFLSRNV